MQGQNDIYARALQDTACRLNLLIQQQMKGKKIWTKWHQNLLWNIMIRLPKLAMQGRRKQKLLLELLLWRMKLVEERWKISSDSQLQNETSLHACHWVHIQAEEAPVENLLEFPTHIHNHSLVFPWLRQDHLIK